MSESTDTAPSLTFGERVRRARIRAGKTRPIIADRMGQSTEWVKAIETGRIGMPRLPKLIRLAHALGVKDITELTGDDRVTAVTYAKAEHAALPSVKHALADVRLKPSDRQPESAAVLEARVREAWKLWHAVDRRTGPRERTEGNRTRMGNLLPSLLADTQHSARVLEEADRRRALVALTETYHLAQLFLSFQQAPDLIALVSDRAMAAALDADSPRAIAGAAWYVNHVHRDAGEAAEARVDLAEQAVSLLPDGEEPDCLARRGLLYLAVALSYAKSGQAGDAWHYWDKADDAARTLGDSYSHPWLIFGRGIVDAYAITMHNDLVQPAKALEIAEALDLSRIPSATRRSYHLIETARAYGMSGERVAVVSLLKKAYEESPETVMYNLHARAVLPELARSAPRMVRDDAQALARDVGVPM
ncbi:multiprotein-bridging factor 1 family protein [Streptomyces sp. NPDC088789]|uniref:helix-turn-helix domain-containing protein n=1 Tax=Streptomyces sp. NPDC088789 TaxID=3365899 RepID=UPI00380D2FA8